MPNASPTRIAPRWHWTVLALAWSAHFWLRAHDIAVFREQDNSDRDTDAGFCRIAALLILPTILGFFFPVRGCVPILLLWFFGCLAVGLMGSGTSAPLTLGGWDTGVLVLATLALATWRLAKAVAELAAAGRTRT
jgi:hypothetical protein